MKFRAGAPVMLLVCAALGLAACTPELNWRELSVPDGHFTALLPCKTRRETRSFDAAAGTLSATMYACSLKQGTMAVAYTDYPTAPPDAEHGRARVDAARDALLRNVDAGAPTEEDIAVAGLPGRRVYAEGRAGAQAMELKALFALDGKRLYQVAYVGARNSVAMADIDLFLDSFKLQR